MNFKSLRFCLLGILAMLCSGVNATEVKLDFTSADEITAMGFALPEASAGTDVTEAFTYKGITVTPYKGTNAVRIWNSNGAYTLRYFKADNSGNKGGISVAVADGNKITRIVVTGNSQLANTTCAPGVKEMSNSNKTLTWTPAENDGNVVSVMFENGGTNTTNVETITVTYEAVGGGSEEPGGETTGPVTALWDFQNDLPAGIQAATNYQGNEADVPSTVEGIVMHVDATSGKFYCVGRNNAQMNPGTILQIPVVSTADVVSVTGYTGYCHFAVGGEENGDQDVVAHTATAAEVTAGYVEITATANNNYIYSIQVVQNPGGGTEEPGTEPVAEDVTATWDWQNLIPASISTTNVQGTDAAGTVASDVDGIVLNVHAAVAGTNIKLQYNASGYAQFNQNTCIDVPVNSEGDVVTVVSYPGQSKYTVGGQDATGQNTFVYTATGVDAMKGYVEVIATATAYLYSIKVEQKAQQPAVVLTDEAVTATFPFNLGVEGQTATFSNDDYFLTSKVAVGSNFTYDSKNATSGYEQTLLKSGKKESAAAATNLLQFLITPKPGFTFTPTKVSFTATRFGTNGGTMDIAWQNADGTTLSLATGQTPNRENATDTDKFSDYSYDLNSATAGEGTCGLAINLYSLDAGKRYGFCNIVIEGKLSGQEKEVPILASFTINGTEYAAADVFGEEFEATLELSKSETMVGENNPLTAVTATNGEVGTITYAAMANACTVTIPVTAGATTMDYVLNVVYKPDFTLTYVDTDGSTITTQSVEKGQTIGTFAANIENAKSTEGKKARGWFKNNYVGEKYATTDVVEDNISLYAIETEIEVASDSRKYVFDLRDKFFYAEDHEAFNPTGKGAWHDATHGWAFSNGDQLQLLVGPKASVLLTLCAYSAETDITVSNGATVAAKAETDGGMGSFNYEGEGGTVTLTFNGTTYVHSITILNTLTTNYDRQGNWFVVKQGDASSFVDALEVANGQTGTDRMFIYLPNGTYDLGQQTLTTVGRNNISIIGESQQGVVIKNKPTAEGIGNTATLYNTAQNLYMQDITLQNAWDYYGGILSGAGAGRAVCLQDKGTKTIAKNVTLRSYQDTYYPNAADGQYYWETSDIHGTVDFICGEGAVFVENSTITVEKRNPDGKGECTITAPSTKAGNRYGYVFNDCYIDNYAEKYNLGRAWNNEPRCAWINTTVSDSKINTKRWTTTGMNNNVVAKEFVEYNTQNGPASNVLEFVDKSGSVKNSYETILTAEQAAEFTLDKVFTSWNPATLATQAVAPVAELNGTTLSWTPVDNAIAYAVYKNGELVTITSELTITVDATTTDVITIRSANQMGGLGIASQATIPTGIESTKAIESNADAVYNLQGMRMKNAQKGLFIVGGKKVVR